MYKPIIMRTNGTDAVFYYPSWLSVEDGEKECDLPSYYEQYERVIIAPDDIEIFFNGKIITVRHKK